MNDFLSPPLFLFLGYQYAAIGICTLIDIISLTVDISKTPSLSAAQEPKEGNE